MNNRKLSGPTLVMAASAIALIVLGVIWMTRSTETGVGGEPTTAGYNKETVNSGSGVPTGSVVGRRAVDFTLVDQNGSSVSLSDFEGKVILLNLSTMWCPPCKQEASEAMSIYNARKDKGFVILNVLIDNERRQPPTLNDIRTWVRRYGLDFPVLADSRSQAWAIYNEQGAIPLNLVIDRNMTIRYKQVGFSRGRIESVIDHYLN